MQLGPSSLGRRLQILLPSTFFLVAALTATLFLKGDLGQWSDDWAFDQRDPATGRPCLGFFTLMPRFLFRPFAYIIVPNLQMNLAQYATGQQVLHIISAFAHVGVAALVIPVLCRLGCRPRVAVAGATLFAVYPAGYEMPFWPTQIGGILACGALLILTHFVCREFTRPPRSRTYLGVVLMGIAIPCFYEQPAACIPAIVFLGAACAPRSLGVFRGLLRGMVVGAAATVGPLLYVVIQRLTTPTDFRGSAQSFIAAGELPDRIRTIFAQAQQYLLLNQFGRGAAVQGFLELGKHPNFSCLVLGLLALAFGVFAFSQPARQSRPQENEESTRPLWGSAFGLAAFVLSWMPVLVIRVQGAEPRLCYIGVCMLAIALACAAEQAARFTSKIGAAGRAIDGVVLATFGIAAIWCTVAMIGIQGAWHERGRRDRSHTEQIRRLVPKPGPSTVFVPIVNNERLLHTGSERFDRCFYGPTERMWSCSFFIQKTLGRVDTICAWLSSWNWYWPHTMGADEKGLIYDESFLTPPERLPVNLDLAAHERRAREWISWDRVIPFTIDKDGRINLIGKVVQVLPDGSRITYVPSQVAKAQRETGVRSLTLTFYNQAGSLEVSAE